MTVEDAPERVFAPRYRREWDFDEVLSNLLEQYRRRGAAIEVDFRDIVPFGSGVDRATHLMHSYPAKLLPNIPLFFLHCSQLVRSRSLISDPFCGTGTVLVEGLLAGHKVIGADSNPLARQIALAKTTRINPKDASVALGKLSRIFGTVAPKAFAPVVNVERWFSPENTAELGKLLGAIDTVEDEAIRRLFAVTASQCIRRFSKVDPRMSVPVVRRDPSPPKSLPPLLDLFHASLQTNIRRLMILPIEAKPELLLSDARHLIASDIPPADLVVTSPPYAGAQKYIRASSLSIGWLNLAPGNKLRALEQQNIGREHLTASERMLDWNVAAPEYGALLTRIGAINPSRAAILGTYLMEMRDAMNAVVRSIRKGGHLVLVMGDNQVCGIAVPTSQLIRDICVSAGLEPRLELVDTIKSRGLMTKRNRSASVIAREHVFLLRKPM